MSEAANTSTEKDQDFQQGIVMTVLNVFRTHIISYNLIFSSMINIEPFIMCNIMIILKSCSFILHFIHNSGTKEVF